MGQRPTATAGPAQAPAPQRLSCHSQLRISEMKTARPRIPSPFDTAGIVARDHGRPATRQITTNTTTRSPRGILQAAATATASTARRRRDSSRAPAGDGRARLWRHLPGRGGGVASRGSRGRRHVPRLFAPLPGYLRRSLGHPAARERWLLTGSGLKVGGAVTTTSVPVTTKGKKAKADVRGARQARGPSQ